MIKSRKEGKECLGISCETSMQFYEGKELIVRLTSAILLASCMGVVNENEFDTLNNAIWDLYDDKEALAKVFKDITGYSMRFILKEA